LFYHFHFRFLRLGVLWEKDVDSLPGFSKRTKWFLENKKDLANEVSILGVKHFIYLYLYIYIYTFYQLPDVKRVSHSLANQADAMCPLSREYEPSMEVFLS
jgi:hypothetical protein